jgi:hypothetical protein
MEGKKQREEIEGRCKGGETEGKRQRAEGK